MIIPDVHLVGGTAEETVRLAPTVLAMRNAALLRPSLVALGSNPTGFGHTLAALGLTPDLAPPDARGTKRRQPDLTPPDAHDPEIRGALVTETIRRLEAFWAQRTPAAVVVAGNTPITLAAALAASWRDIPVVHLDAGRRSGDLGTPYPDEADRRLVAQLATLHLAPTPLAAMNLLDERVAAGDILISGSTAVDAALAVAARRLPFESPGIAAARSEGKDRTLVFVTADPAEPARSRATAHDREPRDDRGRILGTLGRLAERYPDVDLIDARVTGPDPLPYADLARLLGEAYLVVTDVGGIVEVAPSLGVPVLIPGDRAEQVESLDAGCARLTGTGPDALIREASALLDSRVRRDAMTAAANPYGDGHAGRRAAQATAALLGLAEPPEPMPSRGRPLPSSAVS